ncbi:MAG: hypothetical protein PF446_08690 [Oleiagrimonas sp.]|jgi:chemosensory pili system protein ChpB (putative protein-glutamate methylesterase)|nr:hypothetical protein [Oleiagrimonas sp.]
MEETGHTHGTPAVALLFEDAELGAHLRKALLETGARIVFEGPAARATRDDLSGNGADIVVVNLDATAESHLDALYEIVDEDTQRIIFNDAEVSSGLSGWDLARWARHLAAKLIDAHDVDPPRPEAARPVESGPTELLLPDAELPESTPAHETRLSWDANDPGAGKDGEGLSEEDSADLTAELEALLSEDSDLLAPHEEEPVVSGRSRLGAFDIELGETGLPATDTSEASMDPRPEDESVHDNVDEPEVDEDSGLFLDMHADPTSDFMDDSHKQADLATGNDDRAFEEALRMLDEGLGDAPDSDAADATEFDMSADFSIAAQDTKAFDTQDDLLDFEDIPELKDLQFDSAGPSAEVIDDPAQADVTESNSALSTDQMPETRVPDGDAFSLVDIDGDEDRSPAPVETRVEAPQAPDWSLVDFDEFGVAGTPGNGSDDAADTADPSDFGIEKMSAAEFLSPQADSSEAFPEPTNSLELEPLEQALSPKMMEEGLAVYTMDLGEGAGIERAVVIGAGKGEEALTGLRDLLSALTQKPAAAMLGVVHQQGGDLKALADELDQVSPHVSVGVAKNDGRIRHGVLLLVPAGKQAAVSLKGKVQLLDAADPSLSNPSIDLTMTLVAHELRENALAMVLAGDAIDALAGAQAVRDCGGRVWVLDPADCTENTMVSLLCEEQLAQFTGTPQMLAAELLKEFS